MRELSQATKRNWNKLNVDAQGRLEKRANKSCSSKRFVPIEYLSNSLNKSFYTELQELQNANNWPIEDVIYSLGLKLLKDNNIIEKKHVKDVLSFYNYNYIPLLENISIPNDEIDVLGSAYQSLLLEGEKITKGSYYTPKHIVDVLLKNVWLNKNKTFFDPCCGSGAFLLRVKTKNPTLLYGCDIDPIAVFSCKINLLLKFKNVEFIPNIYCGNFLDDNSASLISLFNKKFNYIATNPPWGAATDSNFNIPQITTGEFASLFFVKAFNFLLPKGILNTLMPNAIAVIKRHYDIRSFILKETCLDKIIFFQNKFTNVITSYLGIFCKKSNPSLFCQVVENNDLAFAPLKNILLDKDHVFNFLSQTEIDIIAKMHKYGNYTLENSTFFLGIVTGNNAQKIKKEKSFDLEEIYTGKDVMPYNLKAASNFVAFNRESFQQCAPVEFYRASEKLIYKFINSKLVFSYDSNGALMLNSANGIIPNIPNMSIKTVLAFLNSKAFEFFYTKNFTDVKVLKNNLCKLPFPEISADKNEQISFFVDQILLKNNENYYHEEIQKTIYQIFNFTAEEILYIEKSLNA